MKHTHRRVWSTIMSGRAQTMQPLERVPHGAGARTLPFCPARLLLAKSCMCCSERREPCEALPGAKTRTLMPWCSRRKRSFCMQALLCDRSLSLVAASRY